MATLYEGERKDEDSSLRNLDRKLLVALNGWTVGREVQSAFGLRAISSLYDYPDATFRAGRASPGNTI
jgi:hypothetical protein